MQPGSETNEKNSSACSHTHWIYFFVTFESFDKAYCRIIVPSTNLESLPLRGMDTGSEWRWLSFAPHSYLLTGCWELPPWMEKVRAKNEIALLVRSDTAWSMVGQWSARTLPGRTDNWNSGWLGMSGTLGLQMVKTASVWCQTTGWWRLCSSTALQLSCWVWPLVSLPGPWPWTEWGFGPAKGGKKTVHFQVSKRCCRTDKTGAANLPCWKTGREPHQEWQPLWQRRPSRVLWCSWRCQEVYTPAVSPIRRQIDLPAKGGWE